MPLRFWFVAAVVLSTGCTHPQLRKSTIRHATSVSDIIQQQVLDNLAMFARNAESMPYFAVPDQGTSQVDSKAKLDASIGWERIKDGSFNAFLFKSAGASGEAERDIMGNWVLKPITDPHKLLRMRCAYQKVATGNMSGSCPNCSEQLKEFHSHEKGADNSGPKGVTDDCLYSGWFGVGCKKDVPKHCPCLKVGHYCGTYVWVLPEGEDGLTKLTLAILDYAIYEPVQPTQTVEETTAADGKIETKRTWVEPRQNVKTFRNVRTMDIDGLQQLQQRLDAVAPRSAR